RWIADWRRIVWFFWHYAFPPASLSNQFISKHSLQCHARSVQHHPEIAVRDRKNRTNLFARDVIHLAHCENVSDFLQKLRQAILHRLPEFRAMHDLIWFWLPFFRALVMVPEAD